MHIYIESERYSIELMGSACGRTPTPGLREPARDAPTYTQIPPGCTPHASAAMGPSGRLEFDSSNHGLC
jgi:hypothetical protein